MKANLMLNEGVKESTVKNLDRQAMAEEAEYYSLVRKVMRILAPFYDVAFELLSFGAASKLRSSVVDFADAPRESRILDVATGTGEQAFAFAKKGYDVVGIDLSE